MLKPSQYLFFLMSLVALVGATPRTADEYYSQYVGHACNELKDPPIRGLSHIGMDENGELTLQCSRHFYRVRWEAYDPWAKR